MEKTMIEYDLVIYPRKLLVELQSQETIDRIIEDFVYNDGTKISKDDFIAKGATTSHVMNKYGEYGILVVFSPEYIISTHFAHEAFHVADFIADICGLDYVKDTGNEHIAYLIGYVISLFEDWKNKTFKK